MTLLDRATEPVLRVEGLGMTFPGGVCALRDVSLGFGRDELVVVLGPSGAGKSTLLRSFNRLNAPTAGRIWFHDADVSRVTGQRLRRLRQSVGMIFQQFNLVNRLTVLENVLAGRLRFSGMPFGFVGSHLRWFPRSAQKIALEALERVGIPEKAMHRAGTLSGGQQQRVAIARLLAQEPEAILADEPIASLDPSSAETVMQTLAEIQRSRRVPVIVNLHQVEVARRFATRIIGMNSGRVVFDGSPEALTHDRVVALYGGEPEDQEQSATHKGDEG